VSLLLAFLSAVSWSASDYLGGLHSKDRHFATVTIAREICGIAFFAIAIACTGGELTLRDFFISFGVGLLAGVALPVFFGALASGRMALVAPVAGSIGAIVPIVVGILSGERPSVLQACGLGLAVAAIAFVSIEHVDDGENGLKRQVPRREVLKAAFCGVAFGIFYTGMHHTSEDSGLWPPFFVCFGVLATLLVWGVVRNPSTIRGVNVRALRVCGIGGVLDAIAASLYVIATRDGFLSITAAVASLYPVGTALLARVRLKEHLHGVNIAGLVLCAASLAFIAI
jgi:drug/metabolite transporter (DMT)-like permease